MKYDNIKPLGDATAQQIANIRQQQADLYWAQSMMQASPKNNGLSFPPRGQSGPPGAVPAFDKDGNPTWYFPEEDHKPPFKLPDNPALEDMIRERRNS